MRSFIDKLTNLAALILGVYSWTKSPTIDFAWPVMTLIVAFILQAWQDAFGSLGKPDKELLDKLQKELPGDGSAIRFLNDHSMGDPFSDEHITPIISFLYSWSTADHEFVNRRLEKRRKKFIMTLKAFNDRLKSTSSPHQGNPTFYRIFPHHSKDHEQFTKNANELNELAQNAYLAYDDLVRTGRRLS